MPPERKQWSMGIKESGEKLKSALNGAMFADPSRGFRIAPPKWMVVGLIVLLLIIALGGWVQAIRNSARADGLLTAIQTQKDEFEKRIQEKDLERASLENVYRSRMKAMEKQYGKTKRKYEQRRSAPKKWKQPRNMIETAQRFRSRGFGALLR